MNRINFIKPVPQNRTREVRIWFWLLYIATATTVLVITIYTVTQWYIYKEIHQEKRDLQQQLSTFSSVMEVQRKQIEERNALQYQLNKLTRYSTSPRNPIDLLTSLRTSLGATSLQSFTLTKNNFELHTVCSHAQQANAYLQKLRSNPKIQSVRLVTLQTQQKQLMAIFKGAIHR